MGASVSVLTEGATGVSGGHMPDGEEVGTVPAAIGR
jgi:hypothetical protein